MTTTELLLSAWRFDPIVILGCAVAFAAYARAPRATRAASVAFLSAATLVLAFALVSPVGTLADGYLFSAHMLQHLLLLLVVPPLALLGMGRPIHSAAPTPASSGAGPRYGGARYRAGCWIAGVSAMWVWHAPRLCDAATRSGSIHIAQELSLVVMGLAFWWPILAPREESRLAPFAGIVYLFTACTACTLLGIAITFSPVEVCSIYADPIDRLGALSLLRGGWGLTPERDQQLGGLFMWVPACLVYGAGILGILARWYAAPEEGASTALGEVS
jgi:cytochrome c oxidase assembly factor CtaG